MNSRLKIFLVRLKLDTIQSKTNGKNSSNLISDFLQSHSDMSSVDEDLKVIINGV